MGNNIKLIAQDLNIYDGDDLHSGARTGAISINHLVSAGAEGIILGHSEVGDSLVTVNNKLKTIINNEEIKKSSDNFIFNILLGESWEEFENKLYNQVANTTFEKCKTIFKDIPETSLRHTIIGYEPKWGSRGSGRDDMPPPEPELISVCIKSIKQFMTDNYKNINPFYVYGGRSTPERTLEILSDDNIDGLILGSACNTLRKTMDIVESMKKVKGSKNKVIICNFKAYILPDPYEKYVQELKKLSDDFFIYLAPSYTDIRLLKQLI